MQKHVNNAFIIYDIRIRNNRLLTYIIRLYLINKKLIKEKREVYNPSRFYSLLIIWLSYQIIMIKHITSIHHKLVLLQRLLHQLQLLSIPDNHQYY